MTPADRDQASGTSSPTSTEARPAGDGQAGPPRDWPDVVRQVPDDTMHVEDGNAVAGEVGEPTWLVDLTDGAVPDSRLASCLDAIAETFNARDLDGLLELIAEDCQLPGVAMDRDGLAEMVEDIWERQPTCLLTRGELDEEPVGVLWELGAGDTWWPVASLHVAEPAESDVGVVDLVDDAMTLDRIVAEPPDGDLEEGTRWREWEEGADV